MKTKKFKLRIHGRTVSISRSTLKELYEMLDSETVTDRLQYLLSESEVEDADKLTEELNGIALEIETFQRVIKEIIDASE